jgi:hypothetical protein
MMQPKTLAKLAETVAVTLGGKELEKLVASPRAPQMGFVIEAWTFQQMPLLQSFAA